ncbi:MAG: OmpA family protein [Marinomonas sp.]
MTGFGKFLVGTAGASLLAWGTHHFTGDDYINGLEADGKAVLTEGGYDGVAMEWKRNPLTRGAVLSGVSDPAKRAEIEAAMAAKGIPHISWEGEADAPADGDAGAVATDAAVADCQSGVDGIMEGQTINFKSGSAYMGDDSLGLVSKLAEKIAACEGMNVAVGGHTDATGSAEVNDKLSQARADAVAAALTEKGVDASRITAKGYGSTLPKVEGAGASEENRRIEFVLSNGAADAGSEGEE